MSVGVSTELTKTESQSSFGGKSNGKALGAYLVVTMGVEGGLDA